MTDHNFPYNESLLEGWTENYWSQNEEARPDYYLGPQGYGGPLKPLLQIELECARNRGLLPEREGNVPTTLVILLGTSFEPLLQAICAYQPDRLIPVVNRFYGDRAESSNGHKPGHLHWQDMRNLIKRLPSDLIASPPNLTITQKETVMDDPQAVFDYLRQKLADDLADPMRRVIIDITGAKKTIVAGAYLLAAYSQARISYVDFDRWHKGEGRPYGYSCRISDNVPNPLREWALQDWEHVEEQYRKYNFAAAIEAIPSRERAVWETASNKLKSFLKVCAAWEASDLARAKELHDNLPENLKRHTPLAVKELSRFWSPLNSKREEWLKPSFLLDPRALMIYAEDELARADRLCKHKTRPDNRAAFICVYAVYETMIKARMLILFNNANLNVSTSDIAVTTCDKLPSDHKEVLQNWILSSMQTHQARNLLAKGKMTVELDLPSGAVRLTIENMSLSLEKTTKGEKLLAQDRNLFVHSYVPVSSDYANKAIEMARAYLDEFKNNWSNKIVTTFDKHEKFEPQAFAVPDWGTLKKDCGLDVILPVKNVER